MTVSPWHQLCALRDDVRRGKLTLAEFAADLNGVRTGEAPAVYRDPATFFARTYPTFRMKQLARDVLLRLAGQGGKPVLQLQVAYGGGKTHTLIALYHLVALPSPPGREAGGAGEGTLREFLTFAGLPEPPRARVALLPFDQFDVQEGLEVYGPHGGTRRVMTPWGALAYQLAGDAGYTRLQAHDADFSVPAEPLLVDLLRAPLKEGLGSLVLVDEAVWYYRNLVNQNRRMLGTIKDFFQVLTQAAAKVERAALVASLIASQVEANDQTGIQCLAALEAVFGRIAEPVEPVAREDVSEILRRRLFDRVPGENERRPAVDAVMAAMHRLPLRDAQRDEAAYTRLMESYPFHPDLIDVLYQKWTQMSGFQRTRGALRLLAYALRDAEGRDPAPVVGPGALLPLCAPNQEGEGGLSAALNELVKVCPDRERWTPILKGELDKAREVQAGLPTLLQREVEQAVVATFLHSQPSGQRAQPSELLGLLAHPTVDPAALEEGLNKWRGFSWFLVEDPAVWQLGTVPNLTHMHHQAMGQLTEPEIDDELRGRIQRVAPLAAADVDVEVHKLPRSPRDVGDDIKLHYLILGPECALEPGKPLPAEVEAYYNEITGPNNPRTFRNNLLALTPEISRLAGLREQVRRWLGWQRIEGGDSLGLLTDLQKRELPRRKKEAENGLPEAVVAAYNLLLAVDEAGQVRAQTLPGGAAVGQTPFERIKALLADQERLLTTTLDPDLILPGSYLAIWREGETARRVTDLMAVFGQFPRLPRLLRPAALYDTLTRGVREGVLVLRLPRADGSARTWWLIPPDDETLRRPEMEVQPAGLAELHYLETGHLLPERVPGLWPSPTGPLTLGTAHQFFDGDRAPRLASPGVLETAARAAVEDGSLMARSAGHSLYREPLPAGPLAGELELFPPPPALHGADLTPQSLPEAWSDGQATLPAMVDALTERHGYRLPWTLVGSAADEAVSLRLFEPDPQAGSWPCSPATADQVRFRLVETVHLTPETVIAALDYAGGAAPTLRAIKETIETRFLGRPVPADLLIDAVRTAIGQGAIVEADDWRTLDTAPDQLGVRVRRPAVALVAEATLNPMALQRLADQVDQLLAAARELVLSFRVTLTAEGQRPGDEDFDRLNALLEQIQSGWRLS